MTTDGWIRPSKRCKASTHKTPREAVVRRLNALEWLIHPSLYVCASKAAAEGATLGKLPSDLLVDVSSYLTGWEDGALDRMVATGRVHNDLLVAMARFSCHGRRLVLRNGRCMSTDKSCHRHYCQWRRRGVRCITWTSKYTRSRVLVDAFSKHRPRRCWEGTVFSEDQGRDVLFARWVLSELKSRHAAVLQREQSRKRVAV